MTGKCERCQKVVPILKQLDFTLGEDEGKVSVCPKCFDFLTDVIRVEFT